MNNCLSIFFSTSDGLESTVKCKRSYSNYILPYKLAPAAKSKTTILSAGLPLDNVEKEKHLNENVYVYNEGTVPPSRQMFYQVKKKTHKERSLSFISLLFQSITILVIFFYLPVLRRSSR